MRRPFGLVYRTLMGNDTQGTDLGYKLHLVYGCQASPSERAYGTINDSPEAIAFSWEIATSPVPVTGYAPTALLVVDSTVVDPTDLTAIEDLLYGGGAATQATLPTPDEVLALDRDARRLRPQALTHTPRSHRRRRGSEKTPRWRRR